MKKNFIIPAVLLLIVSGCGQVNNEDHVHDLSYHSKVNATCTVDGYEAYFECLECDKLFSDEMAENEIASPAEIQATGHGDNLHHFAAIPGTCLDAGTKEYYECYACDNYYSDSEGKNLIASPESAGFGEHKPVYVKKVEGSCSTYATEAHYECSVCHKLFTDEACKNETKLEDLYSGSLSNHNLTFHEGSVKTPFVDGSKAYYECSACNHKFADAQGKTQLTDSEIKEASDAWVGFALSYKIGTNSDKVSAEYVKMNDVLFDESREVMGTKVTFKQAMTAGSNFIQDTNGADAKTYGINPRVRLVSGEKITYKMYVKNTGVGDLKLSICFNDNSDSSGFTVDVKEGKSVSLEDTISHNHSSGTKGGWIKVNVLNDVQKNASYEAYGYYKSKDYLPFDGVTNTFKVEQEATHKVFNVGDKFNTDGLRLRMYEKEGTDSTDTGYITSYQTNYDGYTFTDSDVGTKTVYVKFGGVTVSYDIKVNAFHSKCTNLELHKGTKTTNWSNGYSDYYSCTQCEKIYSDAQGNNLTSYDNLKQTMGAWARVTNKKQTFNNDNVGAEYVTINDEIFPEVGSIKATKVTFKNAINNGATWDHPNNWDDGIALSDGVSNRMPLIPGKSVDYKYYIKNTGTSEITVQYQFWNDNNSTVAFTVTLAAGESKIIENTFNVGSGVENSGGWSRYTAKANIAQGAEFVSYWYYSSTNNGYMDFNSTGNKNSVSMKSVQAAKKLTFKVGETFTAEGLVLKLQTACNGGPDGGNIFNYDTNFDGYTFKASDVGTQTVTVRFADASITYNIKVEA